MFSTVSLFFIHFFIFVASCRIQLNCVFIVHCFILCQSLLPSANEIWSKVMFLHLCHSVHRGGLPPEGGLPSGASASSGGQTPESGGVCLQKGLFCIQGGAWSASRGLGSLRISTQYYWYQCFFLSGCLDCFPVGSLC